MQRTPRRDSHAAGSVQPSSFYGSDIEATPCFPRMLLQIPACVQLRCAAAAVRCSKIRVLIGACCFDDHRAASQPAGPD